MFGALIQPDGTILVYGQDNAGTSDRSRPLLARVHSDGSLDSTFGVGGLVSVPDPTGLGLEGGAVSSLLVQPDGKLVIGLHGDILRFESDGTLDSAFGNGGVVLPGADPVALLPGGEILVEGRNSVNDVSISRLEPDGALDPAFGTGGTTDTGLADYTLRGSE